jgi:hypothetical protein
LLWLIVGSCLLAQAPTAQQQQERWNKVFAGSEIPFNHQPNAFLLKSVQGKTPGMALEIGMGKEETPLPWLAWDGT